MGFPGSSAWSRIHLQCRRPWFNSWIGKIPWRRNRLPTSVFWASFVDQLVKNLPAMQETLVQFLDQEDPREKGKATHSSILAWRIPWTVHGVTKRQTRLIDFHFISLTWYASRFWPRVIFLASSYVFLFWLIALEPHKIWSFETIPWLTESLHTLFPLSEMFSSLLPSSLSTIISLSTIVSELTPVLLSWERLLWPTVLFKLFQ